jgi:hypothetical protein
MSIEPEAKFGRLTVISRVRKTVDSHWIWACRCECGNLKEIHSRNLLSGSTSSCGCLQREARRECASVLNLTHGESRRGAFTPEYRAWRSMISRCEHKKYEYWDRYGGRGISVCEKWRRSYPAFLVDVGRRPSKSHTLDRKDNDGNYEPGNVRWATGNEQRRNTSQSVLIEVDGRKMCVTDWARELGMSRDGLRSRLMRGWSPEKTVLTKSLAGRPWNKK